MHKGMDLTAEAYAVVQDVLRQHLPKDCNAWVFGSRAKQTAHRYSDLDLALSCHQQPLPEKTRSLLRDAFDEAHLAFSVDVVDLNDVDASFQALIIDDMKPFVWDEGTVPNLRFSEFKGEWVEKRLNDISSNVMYGMNSAAIRFDGINKYIRITDIDEVSRAFKPNPLTSPDGKLEDKYKLKNGDIVFTRTGASVGKSYMYQENDGILYFAGFLIRFSIISANTKFVFQQTLRSFYDKWVLVMSMRSGQPGINAEEYKLLKLYVPEQTEQQKIADFLTAVDKRIAQLEEKKRLLTEYKKGVMQQIFSQQLRFTDDNGNPYPDWEEKRLGDVVSLKMTNSLSRSALNYESGQVLNIHYGDIHTKFKSNFHLSKEHVPYINDNIDLSRVAGDCYCKVGDIIIADASEDYKDIGKTIEIIKTDGKQLLSGLHTYLARPDKSRVAVGFLGYLMQAKYVRLQIMRLAQGVSVLGISKGNIAKVAVKIPSFEEQQKIADFLTAIDNKIEQVGAQFQEAKAFKKGLFQQMFV